MSPLPHFFSCDWGTTTFRLRLVQWEGRRVLDEWREDGGVKAVIASLGDDVTPRRREEAFARFLGERLEALCQRHNLVASESRVIVSGMASSSVGWQELPYATTPFPLDGSRVVVRRVAPGSGADREPQVWLISGVRTPVDIMRGEECEIMGVFGSGLDPALVNRAVMVLPGTHSKHVSIERGAIVDFSTYMTGELCDVLARHSLLRQSVRWPLDSHEPNASQLWAFEEGVALARERGLSRNLFRVRTRSVLDAVDPATNGWFLSGLLIGTEVGELIDGVGSMPIVLASSPRFHGLYGAAIRVMGGSERLQVIPPKTMEMASVHTHASLLERLLGAESSTG
jgi:2-dehydro-3-deoxygalactonokinase